MNAFTTAANEKSPDIKHEGFLPALGVYGFQNNELTILSALVTEDPLLLIGKSGTGKTYLLNSLSEALSLEHRHYNASLISFDDLVGFPFPEQDKGTVRFLETPATVWPAESVLIDELSRCKPEHQNRLFSLIHERRIQGQPILRLRYRWAAMNPPSVDQGGEDDYLGSEPLDPALADRFALFVIAADWDSLNEEERIAIATPSGEGRIADDGGVLSRHLAHWRQIFLEQLDKCPGIILAYVTNVANNLLLAGIRVSPRRTRLIARSLLAAEIIAGKRDEAVFKTILKSSLPQVSGLQPPDEKSVLAAHRAAWDAATHAERAWVHAFLSEPKLARKIEILVNKCPGPDAGSQAISELIASEKPERSAALAFVLFPAASSGALPIGPDGINDLGKIAGPMLAVNGELSWAQAPGVPDDKPANLTKVSRLLNSLEGPRKSRARQFFYHCLIAKLPISKPGELEEDINAAVEFLRRWSAQ